jgi:hypothetical protein
VLGQSSTSLSVSENSLATSIGIAAPVDTSFGSAALTVMVTALPSNGTILLADGVTPVNVGQSLAVQQLIALRFRPAFRSGRGQRQRYSCADNRADYHSAAGDVDPERVWSEPPLR